MQRGDSMEKNRTVPFRGEGTGQRTASAAAAQVPVFVCIKRVSESVLPACFRSAENKEHQ